MMDTHFENSSGLPAPNHYTTARDMSLLAIAMIRDFPQYYKYYSVREFEHNGIKQQNRNGLLGRDPSVDGLKTGHTDSAGYCLVTSALRDGMRVVSVVLGSEEHEGPRERQRGADQLRLHLLRHEAGRQERRQARAPRRSGRRQTRRSMSASATICTSLCPARQANDVKTTVEVQPRLIAPLARDATVGQLRVFAGSQTLATLPMHPLQSVAAGSWWRRLIRHHPAVVCV